MTVDLQGMDLQPLHARVIIKRKPIPERASIIFIPSSSKEMEPTEGTVVAVGNECKAVNVGDEVYFGRYSGFTFERGGEKYVFCNEEDILATINPWLMGVSNG